MSPIKDAAPAGSVGCSGAMNPLGREQSLGSGTEALPTSPMWAGQEAGEALVCCSGLRLGHGTALDVKGTQSKAPSDALQAQARVLSRVPLAGSPLQWPSVHGSVLGRKPTVSTEGDEAIRTGVPRASAGGQDGVWMPLARLLHREQPPPGPTQLFP